LSPTAENQETIKPKMQQKRTSLLFSARTSLRSVMWRYNSPNSSHQSFILRRLIISLLPPLRYCNLQC